MTDSEKLKMLKSMLNVTGSGEDDRLTTYLIAAEKEILAWRYRNANANVRCVPVEYEMTQIHAVLTGYTISGAEGQTSHNENGISRTFAYDDMLKYIHTHVIPIVKVI